MVSFMMRGLTGANIPVNLAVDILIDNWKGFLPRFKSTHHQLGNFDIRGKNDTASLNLVKTEMTPVCDRGSINFLKDGKFALLHIL